MTPLAGAKASLDTLTNCWIEGAMFPLWFAGWTGQSTKNTRRRNTDKGLTIIPRVARDKGAVELFGVWQIDEHGAMLDQFWIGLRRFSGAYSIFAQ